MDARSWHGPRCASPGRSRILCRGHNLSEFRCRIAASFLPADRSSTEKIRSAEGGQPGTKTSTGTTSWTGRTIGSSGGIDLRAESARPAWRSPGRRVSSTAFAPKWLRIAGTLPVTAQSPKVTRILVRARTWRMRAGPPRWRPRLRPASTSTFSGNSLTSTSGLRRVDVLRQLDQPLVDVEERHVAAGAAVQPDRGQSNFDLLAVIVCPPASG